MMGRHEVLAQAIGQVVGDAFRQSPGVDEHQGGAVGLDQLGEAIIHVRPNGIGRDRAEFVLGCVDSQIHLPALSHVNDVAGVWRPYGFPVFSPAAAADQESGNGFQGSLRGGKPDAIRFHVRDGIQAFEGKRDVRAAFVPGQGVDFIDDDRADGAQDIPALAGRQEQVQGFGRGDENMGRAAKHVLSIFCGRVARADFDPYLRKEKSGGQGVSRNLTQRLPEILLHVVAQGLERRDVENLRVVGQVVGERLLEQGINRRQKGGQGFARPRGRGNKRVFAGANGRPTGRLDVGGCADCVPEPAGNDRMERRKRHVRRIGKGAS